MNEAFLCYSVMFYVSGNGGMGGGGGRSREDEGVHGRRREGSDARKKGK